MALDHAGHQELALGVKALGAVCRKGFRLRHDGRDAFAIDQDLARERRCSRTVPHAGIIDQQSHRFSLPRNVDHNPFEEAGWPNFIACASRRT